MKNEEPTKKKKKKQPCEDVWLGGLGSRAGTEVSSSLSPGRAASLACEAERYLGDRLPVSEV